MISKLYKTYKSKCKEVKAPIQDKNDFKKTVEKQQKILSYQLSLGSKSPWIISKIDNLFVIYATIKDGKAIVNIWNDRECEAITGTKIPRNE